MDKIVKFSGFCEATFEAGMYYEKVDGFIIQIDGVNYAAYVDPYDGYRSYSAFFETNQPCTNTFPPQEVIWQVKNDGNYDNCSDEEPRSEMLYLLNPTTKETILEAGTIWYDSYYPMGVCFFNPEAMPINK